MGKEFLNKLKGLLPELAIIEDELSLQPYCKSPRRFFENPIAAVLLPETTQQVAKILALANQMKQPIIPQGGNTGLVGGQQACGWEKLGVVLSLQRMNKILGINVLDRAVTAQAGVVLAELQNKVQESGLFFPLTLASQQSCQIGGNLATNAGGVAALSYGSMRDLCYGLEFVLPDGRIINELRSVKKDNMGYDLKNLIIGSEGSLGVITSACLKLFPIPKGRIVAYAACATIEHILQVFTALEQEFAMQLTSFELLNDQSMDLSLRYNAIYERQCKKPIDCAAQYFALIEISSFANLEKDLDSLQNKLQEMMDCGCIYDATIAQNMAQAEYFWSLRERLSEAQKYFGASIKNDISVPISRWAEFLKNTQLEILAYQKGARIVAFGHIGDGNLHYNILQPEGMDGSEFLAKWHDIVDIVNKHVILHNGSIAAEHGIGQLKSQAMKKALSTETVELMRQIKQIFDPNNIMNPGKIF